MIAQWIGPMERSGIPKVAAFGNRLAAALADPIKKHHRSADWYDTAHPVNHDVPPVKGSHVGLGHHHDHGKGRDHTNRHLGNPDLGNNDGSGAGITINVTVEGNIYGAGGTKQLAADLEKYLRRSTRGGQRLVGAY
jgi:hypothetical protein